MNLFISYTMKDKKINEGFLREFQDKVAIIGKAYVDLIDNDSINKQKRVYEELQRMDCLILIESPFTKKSKWVSFELRCAEKYNKQIIKFTLEEVDKVIKGNIDVENFLENKMSAANIAYTQ